MLEIGATTAGAKVRMIAPTGVLALLPGAGAATKNCPN